MTTEVNFDYGLLEICMTNRLEISSFVAKRQKTYSNTYSPKKLHVQYLFQTHKINKQTNQSNEKPQLISKIHNSIKCILIKCIHIHLVKI